MSAPTPAPGDDQPREGYYPDPSIPGYVRYWNGASWVPGTSRPAPSDGAPLTPPGPRPAASVPTPAAAPAEETGPHFFDEDPRPAPDPRRVSPAEAQHGSRPEPAAAWGADRSQQSGFGGEQDRRVSWGAPPMADPRLPRAAEPGDAVVQPDGESARADGTATIPPADRGGTPQPPASDGTMMFRRPTGPAPSTGAEGASGAAAPAGGARFTGTGHPDSAAHPAPSEGAMTFRPSAPRTGPQRGAQPGGTASADGAPGADTPAASGSAGAGGGFGAGQAAQAAAEAAARPAQPAAAAQQPPTPAPSTPATPSVPQQSTGPAGTPLTSGPGGGQPSWAQQVHRLAGDPGADGQPVTPWKPPVDDVFQAAARRQSAARPASLGRRLLARIVDTAVLATVTAVPAVPLGTKAIDHINEKVDAAKRSGQTVTVWLLDGTTTGYLGIVLAVLLLFGVLYDVLPTAKWGRTLGKKVCGIEVRDIESHEPPSFGRALRRWLVYAVPGVLVIGAIGVLWCVFDKPWRQCWHDKAAHTFVAA
ncbi:RDD family protein [Streptomyces sp. NBC_01450]|uniref:RDD family protein n=1 Tax=Streptomyces sp. NBC_01450 TaxID=2903871 RepID=UPI002E336514|nr:RDD family protein [Streptomyces sp. NBC_01450]